MRLSIEAPAKKHLRPLRNADLVSKSIDVGRPPRMRQESTSVVGGTNSDRRRQQELQTLLPSKVNPSSKVRKLLEDFND